MADAPPGALGSHGSYKWELLLLLWLAFFLNQADRQIFAVVLPLIREELRLSDAELGLIASSLVWTYGLLVPLAGFAGDRFSRKKIIGFSLLLWSGATMATGLCSTLVQFILLRGITTGGGEAFYAPSANALLSQHHQKTRSLALSIHQTAVYAGIILSGLIAGRIAETYGWRYAFFSFGLFGVVLGGIIFLRLQRETVSNATRAVSERVSSVTKEVFKKGTVVLLTAAFACMVFVNVAYLTWMPTLLVEKFRYSLSDAGFHSMLYHHLGAFLGVLVGGIVADRLRTRISGSRLLVQALGLLLGAPFIYLMANSSTTSGTYVALFLFGVFRGVYDSNIFASLYEVVRPVIRSTSSGLMLMFAFLVGAFSPYLLGVLKPVLGFSSALGWLWIFYIAGGSMILVALLRYYRSDSVMHLPAE